MYFWIFFLFKNFIFFNEFISYLGLRIFINFLYLSLGICLSIGHATKPPIKHAKIEIRYSGELSNLINILSPTFKPFLNFKKITKNYMIYLKNPHN